MNRTPARHPAQARLSDLLDHVRAYVEYQRDSGVDALPRRPHVAAHAPPAAAPPPPTPPPTPPAPPTPNPSAPAERTPTAAAPVSRDLFAAPEVQRTDTLEALRAALGDCQRC